MFLEPQSNSGIEFGFDVDLKGIGFEHLHHVFEFPPPPQIHLPQIRNMWQMMEIAIRMEIRDECVTYVTDAINTAADQRHTQST